MPPGYTPLAIPARAVFRMQERGPQAVRGHVPLGISESEARMIIGQIVSLGRRSTRPPPCLPGAREVPGRVYAHYARREGVVVVIDDGAVSNVVVAEMFDGRGAHPPASHLRLVARRWEDAA